mgnify:CR=1 FL=1
MDELYSQSGDFLAAVDQEGIGPDHILAELGELPLPEPKAKMEW